MLESTFFIFRVLGVYIRFSLTRLLGFIASIPRRITYKPTDAPKNVIVLGASFAGYHCAKKLASTLPSGYRVVVIEKNSHFQFTWVFPRFSVISGHEWKAFVPYGGYFDGVLGLGGAPAGSYQWIKGKAVRVDAHAVHLESGESVAYEYLVLAMGATAEMPSRLGVADKRDGIAVFKSMQERVRSAENIVVVGGGPAGVELATDIMSAYKDKKVTLIHSRSRLLHNFGDRLHKETMKVMGELGVRVILGQRANPYLEGDGVVELKEGEKIPCDLFVRCTGQRAATETVAEFCASAISGSGHLNVKPTLQVDVNALTNVYAAGDIIEIGGTKNGRSATQQAEVVADNICRAIRGKPLANYQPMWLEGGIDMSLGLDKGVIFLEDGEQNLLIHKKSTDIAMRSSNCWRLMGAKTFRNDETEQTKA